MPEAIRSAILQATRKQAPARVLDLGAGTGRIGKAFVAADDFYVGVDSSLGMLQEFLLSTRTPCLAQADGQRLPFRDGAFDVVMLMQVLSGSGNWHGLLSEARRVLRRGGAVVVGHRLAPAAGVDAQLKKRLAAILETMGVEQHQGKQFRDQALAWLGSSAALRLHLRAATWERNPTPREFLVRHRTGARFAALPDAVQDEALQKLSAWAETTFGSFDAASREEHSFELDVFQF
ncbi:MAG: class I SAM-dependent methyltransferase [Acidobacteria bacterium]|nr:class I SAM-dependent methyltransferase [Acidobacteriota bacterium]